MTENTTEYDGINPSELFARASELPESNFEARTLAQKLACVAVGALVVIGNLVVAL